MKGLIVHATEEDMAKSGPHVWPKITADQPYDRFIHRRPELIYLQARRKMLDRRKKRGRDLEPIGIGIRIDRRAKNEGIRRTQSLQRFTHVFNTEDDLEDVRKFLESLRHMLRRCMPDKPLLNCSVMIKFYDLEEKTKVLLTTAERWI